MRFYIVIPAHNEENYLKLTLNSLVNQTLLPSKIVVVNDNSTDTTQDIISSFSKEYKWISGLNISSSKEHIPGSKVVNAFYKGLETLDDNYDIICKFDADLIFPENYLESIANLFKLNPKIGIAGGLPFIKKHDSWIFEKVASKNHVRGPLKAYRKSCFEKIGGIKSSIGWDTLDVLLAQYHGWETTTDKTLHVKHLKPTGKTYSKTTKHLQGEALYKIRYGLILSTISTLKSAFNRNSFKFFINTLKGYFKAKKEKAPYLVTKEEGKFIRSFRYKTILKKIYK
ncbi:MAG: glycosyltransferase family 2 protein [Flavobacteriaceae bacterium]|nr:glycosyltransferase family 2 protein [Flavobacteriaceae bacterium]